MPLSGVLIKTSPDADSVLIPDDNRIEPPLLSTPSPAVAAIEPPDTLPAPDVKVMSPPVPA